VSDQQPEKDWNPEVSSHKAFGIEFSTFLVGNKHCEAPGQSKDNTKDTGPIGAVISTGALSARVSSGVFCALLARMKQIWLIKIAIHVKILRW
jgi:hypothetical protein